MENNSVVAYQPGQELIAFLKEISAGSLPPQVVKDSLDQFERIIRLRAESDFNDAMGRARKKITRVIPDKKNPMFHSRYASYSAYLDACEGALNEEGIVVRFEFAASGNPSWTTITCILSKGMHSVRSSQDIGISAEGPKGGRPAMNDSQARGSAITYAMKFMLKASLNLAVEEDEMDDDGNKSGTRRGTAPKTSDIQAEINKFLDELAAKCKEAKTVEDAEAIQKDPKIRQRLDRLREEYQADWKTASEIISGMFARVQPTIIEPSTKEPTTGAGEHLI